MLESECRNCKCKHHCGKECNQCRNDVCQQCSCEHCDPKKSRLDGQWAWQDSGVEQGF